MAKPTTFKVRMPDGRLLHVKATGGETFHEAKAAELARWHAAHPAAPESKAKPERAKPERELAASTFKPSPKPSQTDQLEARLTAAGVPRTLTRDADRVGMDFDVREGGGPVYQMREVRAVLDGEGRYSVAATVAATRAGMRRRRRPHRKLSGATLRHHREIVSDGLTAQIDSMKLMRLMREPIGPVEELTVFGLMWKLDYDLDPAVSWRDNAEQLAAWAEDIEYVLLYLARLAAIRAIDPTYALDAEARAWLTSTRAWLAGVEYTADDYPEVDSESEGAS
jgi:hypothetical protein